MVRFGVAAVDLAVVVEVNEGISESVLVLPLELGVEVAQQGLDRLTDAAVDKVQHVRRE